MYSTSRFDCACPYAAAANPDLPLVERIGRRLLWVVALGCCLNRSILAVDSEPGVACVVASMLRRDGYEVGNAGSAAEAVQMIGDGARPDVLVTEFILPDTDGVALADGIRLTIPNLAVLILTTGALPLPQKLARNNISVLAKPFTPSSLREAVFALLEDTTEKKEVDCT